MARHRTRVVHSEIRETMLDWPRGITPRQRVQTPEAAFAVCLAFGMPLATTEEFWALLLDAQHQRIAAHHVSRGTVSMSVVHPREVFIAAIREGASAIILAHNHPSGDLTPSPEDLTVTRRLVQAGALLGIPVIDHIIVTLDHCIAFSVKHPQTMSPN